MINRLQLQRQSLPISYSEFCINIYSREICTPLFEAAEAFIHLPSTEKQALKNAVAWTQRCSELMPGKESRFSGLIKKLEQKVGD